MPTYEYQCKACGNTWEQDQKIKEPPVKDCPKCGEPKAKRLISGGTGFQLVGSGWASDGYTK
jgi:putative FmdB family regulatory protein